MRKIGIMGGTFDPIHYGHLLAAEESLRNLDLDEVIFVPTGSPPHKSAVTYPQARYDMTLLATYGVSYFSVSDTELRRNGYSHTVDTLREFHETMPDAQFFFITGLDAILSLPTWKSYMELPDLCTLVTVTRPGYPVSGIHSLPEIVREALVFVEIPPFSVSSTDIRARRSQGKEIRYLVPEPVELYISKQRLYREEVFSL